MFLQFSRNCRPVRASHPPALAYATLCWTRLNALECPWLACAQVARQQGEYLAGLLKQGLGPHGEVPEGAVPFRYGHKGSLAYIGGDKAVMDVPNLGPIKGLAAGLLWRGFETYSQFSIRNILLVSMDWVRTKIFGRDISRF